MPDDSVSYRDYRGVDGVVADADPVVKAVLKTALPSRRSNAVTTEQALRSERKAEEGEGIRSFGAPLSTPKPAASRQHTDDSQ